MFEKSLETHFKNIFGVEKISFSQPSEVKEQSCLFIDIEDARNTIKDGEAKAMVSGSAFIYGRAENIPFGFFSKKIEKASNEETKNFFFQDFENNTKYFGDLVQRGFNFIYFFKAQYDPELGKIDSINFEVQEAQK